MGAEIGIGRGVEAQTEEAAYRELLSLSNWGRWGEDDERGALNTVDQAAVARGLAAVRRSVTYSLGAEISERKGPSLPGRPRPRNLMEVDGGDWAGAGPERGRSDVRRTNYSDRQIASDTLIVSPHGTTSHLDGLAHVWSEHLLYNGVEERHVRSSGARRLGIEKFGGVVTRGLLLDVAGLHEVDRLPPDHVISPAEVAACLAPGNLRIMPGDAVLVRTGWSTSDPAAYGQQQPGVGAPAALELARRDICVLGADNGAVEPWGTAPGSDSTPPRTGIHIPYLRNLGIYLLEMLDLEAVAEDDVHEFLFCLAPLRISGGTGSPVNPLAVA